MPRRRKADGLSIKPRSRPGMTPESRMKQLVAEAVDLVEKRLLNGTATSQETTTLIRYGSESSKLEIEKLKRENELLAAKTAALESEKRIEELYLNALNAMRDYSGTNTDDEED